MISIENCFNELIFTNHTIWIVTKTTSKAWCTITSKCVRIRRNTLSMRTTNVGGTRLRVLFALNMINKWLVRNNWIELYQLTDRIEDQWNLMDNYIENHRLLLIGMSHHFGKDSAAYYKNNWYFLVDGQVKQRNGKIMLKFKFNYLNWHQ